MMTTHSITSGQRKQYRRLVEDALDGVAAEALTAGNPDFDGLQEVIEQGDGLRTQVRAAAKAALLALFLSCAGGKFADEEVGSDYEYPAEHRGPKPLEAQIDILARAFGLDPAPALAYAKGLPELPEGAEGWFAVPRWQALASTYGAAFEQVIAALAATRTVYNWREGQLGPEYLRMRAHTKKLFVQATKGQEGDILIIPAQFGRRWRGKSVRRAHDRFRASDEFGLTAIMTGAMILTHLERFVCWEQLHLDCSGDEYSGEADGRFDEAPFWDWVDGELRFGTDDVAYVCGRYGSGSAFVPQKKK